jgi:AraC-like DNA-binding protein
MGVPRSGKLARRDSDCMEYLKSHPLFETSDLDEARRLTSLAWHGHKSDLVSGAGAFYSKVNSVELNSSRLSYVTARGAIKVTIEAGVPDLPLALYLPLQGRSALESSQWRQVAAPGMIAIPPLEAGLTMITSEVCESIFLHTPKNSMRDRLSALLARPIQGEIGFQPCDTGQHGAADKLIRLVSYLSEDLGGPDDTGLQPLAVRQSEELLLSLVLWVLPHRYSDELHSGSSTGTPAHIRLVEEFIDANLESALSMADFARVAGVSSRTLHEAFRTHRLYTPMEFLRKRRLAHVRIELENPTPETSVAGVASKWGFAHLGRFAHAYAVEFKERPSVTLNRGRASRRPQPPS